MSTTTDRVAEEAQRLAEQEKAAEDRRAQRHAKDVRRRREEHARHVAQNREREEVEARERQNQVVGASAADEAERAARGAAIAIENFGRRHALRRDLVEAKTAEAVQWARREADGLRDSVAAEWCERPGVEARIPAKLFDHWKAANDPEFAAYLAAAELSYSPLSTEQVQARRKAALAHEASAKAAAERAAVAAGLGGPDGASQAMDARDAAVKAAGQVRGALDAGEA